MGQKRQLTGRQELQAILRRYRGLFAMAGLFSLAANLLMLSGPIYMMQVYNRVLTFRATETLVALTVILAFLYAMLALMDLCRARVMTRIAAGFRTAAEERVFPAGFAQLVRQGQVRETDSLQDLFAVERFIGSPGMLALLDLPWVPIFFAVFFILHPALGWLALASAALLAILTIAGHLWMRGADHRSRAAAAGNAAFLAQARAEAEVIWAMGEIADLQRAWAAQRADSTRADVTVQDARGGIGVLSKALRLFLQSAMLGLGAWLTIRGELGAGAMLAASVMLGRALAPFEALFGHWQALHRARLGWRNLALFLETAPPLPTEAIPAAVAGPLNVQNITLAPPGSRMAKLSGISFDLAPGTALGVIGPSGSGKSVLARAILGIWPSLAGRILLGGVEIAHLHGLSRRGLIGFLPQQVGFLEGTMADNIARFDGTANRDRIVAAVRAAAAETSIQSLPEGYETAAAVATRLLSAGELQRIGLARALYGDPALLVLDAPNANLDNAGSQALNAAVRAVKERGGIVVIMAHRPAAIQECDQLLVLDQGRMRAFGPKAEVLEDMVRNAEGITLATRKGAA